jgi:hypothetical protein
MARPTPKDLETKAVLDAAAAKLRAGQTIPAADRAAVADAIDLVLSPKGMPLIGRLQTLRDDDTDTTNVAIRMPVVLREHLKKEAAVAHATLSDDAADALNAFIDGEFAPVKQQRAPRGAAGTSATKSGNLNVTPPTSLIEQALHVSEERIGELGWMPRPSHIIAAYLIDKYGRPDDTRTE